MTATAVKKQLATYLPLLNLKQQTLLLDVVKSILNVDETETRLGIKKYNKELKDAEIRISKGKFVSHEQVEKELLK
ncbi:MAG: hypothetical protein WCP52_13480 [Bacteroidota bacterium]